MRKLICIFTACLSFFIFYLSFSIYGDYENRNMDNFINLIIDQTHRNEYAYQVNMENMEQDIKDIQQFAKDNDYLVYLGNSTMDGMNKILSQYVYDYDDSHLKFDTINGKKIAFSSDSSNYLSTSVLDKDCYDHIDFVDKRNEKAYQDIIRFYPISQYPKNESYTKINNLFLYTYLSKDEHNKLINNSKIAHLIETEVVLDGTLPSNENSLVVFEIMLVCGISICLLFICQSIKKQKEIMLRRMMGTSASFITKQLMLKQMILYFLVYLAVQIICYLIVVGNIRDATIPFILILMKYLIAFVVFLVLVYGIVYLYIKKSRKFIHLKDKGQSKVFRYTNLLLKFLILLLILPTFLQFTNQGWVSLNEYRYLVEHRDEIRNQVYSYSIDDRQEGDDFIEGIANRDLKLNTFFDKHGAIYQDFASYEIRKIDYELYSDDEELATFYLPYIIVNRNYLDQYELKAIDGSTINLDDIKKETLFVPESRKPDESTIYNYCDGDCDIVPIKSGNTFWNMSIESSIRSLQDPLIVYSTDVKTTMGINSYRLNLSDDKLKEELAQFLKDNNLDKTISLKDTSNDYDVITSKYQDHLLYLLPLFITYIFVISIYIYQSAYIYFNDNKNRFVLGYLMGNSFLSRHGDMIYKNILIYVPMMIILYFVMNLSAFEAIFSVGLMMLFELVCDYLMVHVLEKRYMIEILKGD